MNLLVNLILFFFFYFFFFQFASVSFIHLFGLRMPISCTWTFKLIYFKSCPKRILVKRFYVWITNESAKVPNRYLSFFIFLFSFVRNVDDTKTESESETWWWRRRRRRNVFQTTKRWSKLNKHCFWWFFHYSFFYFSFVRFARPKTTYVCMFWSCGGSVRDWLWNTSQFSKRMLNRYS